MDYFVKADSGLKLPPVVLVVYEFGGVVGRARSGASFLFIFFLLLSSACGCKASMLKKEAPPNELVKLVGALILFYDWGWTIECVEMCGCGRWEECQKR